MSRPAIPKTWRPGRRSAVPHQGGAGFICAHCGVTVAVAAPGTHQRNHCPHCLWSLHVDVRPGDRAHLCRSPMEPIALWSLRNGELRLIHRCVRCGVMKANRVAGDDDEGALELVAGRRALTARLRRP